MPHTGWSAEELRILRESWLGGVPVAEIQRRLPYRTTRAILRQRYVLKLPARTAHLYQPNPSLVPKPQRAGKTTLPPLTSLGC